MAVKSCADSSPLFITLHTIDCKRLRVYTLHNSKKTVTAD